MDDGTLNPQSFRLVSGYDGVAETYTITSGVEGIQSGGRYRFLTTAVNELGESALSSSTRISVGSLPS